MNSLTPKTPETIYYTAVSTKLLESYFSRWPMAAILDFCQLRLMPTLLRGTPLQFYSLAFKEDKNTKKRTFALHGHGSTPDDPTKVAFEETTRAEACESLGDVDLRADRWYAAAHARSGGRVRRFALWHSLSNHGSDGRARRSYWRTGKIRSRMLLRSSSYSAASSSTSSGQRSG